MALKSLRVSKERVLTISLIVVAYLLVATYLTLDYPFPRPTGNIDVQYTSPIPQATNFTVYRESYTSTNSAVILNLTPYTRNRWHRLPRFEYDFAIFNITLEPKNQASEATFFLDIADENPEITQMIENRTTLSIQTNFTAAKNASDNWIIEIYTHISPLDDFICHSLIVWADSSVPLCPVTIDLRSTSGQSFFENPYMSEMTHTYPSLYISRDNLSSSNHRVYPRSVNHSFYLRPGSLNGTCKWEHSYYDLLSFNVSFSENERVALILNLIAVKVELTFDTQYPAKRIAFWESYDDEIYYLHLTPAQTPSYLFVPPWDLDVGFSIVDPLDERSGSWRLEAIVQTGRANIDVNGSYNLHIDVELQEAMNVVQTWDLVLGVLSFTVFALFILRFGLWLNTMQTIPKQRLIVDFRLIPPLLFMIMAFIPWFSSTRIYDPLWQNTLVQIHSELLGPFPLLGVWTQGSILMLIIPSQAIAWSGWSIGLYWFPLLLCIHTCRTPSSRIQDVLMGLLLIIPAGYPYFLLPILDEITLGVVHLSLIPRMMIIIPIAWLVIVGILSRKGYYVFGEDYNRLERDHRLLKELKPVSPEKKEERPINFTAALFDIRLYLFILVAFFAPCIMGLRHSYFSSDSIVQVAPLQALTYIFDEYGHFITTSLAALLVGLPYALFSTLNLVWLWERLNHQKSMIWVLFGSIISVISMIPGIMILNWIGWLRMQSPYVTWYTWTPFPLMTFMILGFAVLFWLYEVYIESDAYQSGNAE